MTPVACDLGGGDRSAAVGCRRFPVSLCRRRMGQYHWGPEGTLSGAGMVGAGWIVTNDSASMRGEAADSTAAALEEPAGSAVALTDAGSVGALQRSVRHATLGLAAYTVVALGLIGWSLRRGRLSDAVLLLVAMAVTLPPILSYRKQLRKRLQAIAGGAVAGGSSMSSEPGGDVATDASIADAAVGQASTPRSEA